MHIYLILENVCVCVCVKTHVSQQAVHRATSESQFVPSTMCVLEEIQ